MSPKKCVQILVSVLASSGVAAILSGGALAAGNGQDTASQNVYLQQDGASAAAQPAVTGSAAGSHQTYQVDQQNYSVSQDTSASKGTGQGANSGFNGPSSNSGQFPAAVQGGVPVSSGSSAVSVGTGGTVAGDNGVTMGAPKTSSDKSASAITTVPEVAVVSSLAPAPAADNNVAPAAVATTTVMPIQPVITNRPAAMNQDLAGSMPTAPVPARAPVPAKSTGVLGGIVVGLSSILVPQPFTPTHTAGFNLLMAVAVLTLVVLLSNVFVFSYGQWLRRGGFATAARSDDPAGNITSPLFATPLFSGYVESPLRLHNPFLMVLVPNAYRKEERR